MLFWCHSRRLIRVVPFVLLALGLNKAYGAAQYYGGDIGVSALSDDNYGLSTFAKNDVSGTSVQARGRVRWETELSELDLSGRLVDENLNEDDVDENDVLQVILQGNRRLERGRITSRAAVIQDTTLADDALSSGVTLVDVGRDRYSLALSGEYFFTETQGASVSAYGEAVRFEEYSPTLSEYDYTSLDARYLWAMHETLTAYISGVWSRIEYEDNVRLDLVLNGSFVPDRTNIESGSLGVNWTLADKWSLDASLGYRQTDYFGRYYFILFPATVYTLETEEEGDGRISNLSLQYQGERTLYTLSYYQEILPNTSGLLIDERRLEMVANTRLSENVRLNVRAYASEQRSEIDTDNRDNIDVAYGLMGFDWRFRKSLSVRGSYRYIYRRYITSSNDTESNRVTLGLYWTPTPFEW